MTKKENFITYKNTKIYYKNIVSKQAKKQGDFYCIDPTTYVVECYTSKKDEEKARNTVELNKAEFLKKIKKMMKNK